MVTSIILPIIILSVFSTDPQPGTLTLARDYGPSGRGLFLTCQLDDPAVPIYVFKDGVNVLNGTSDVTLDALSLGPILGAEVI